MLTQTLTTSMKGYIRLSLRRDYSHTTCPVSENVQRWVFRELRKPLLAGFYAHTDSVCVCVKFPVDYFQQIVHVGVSPIGELSRNIKKSTAESFNNVS